MKPVWIVDDDRSIRWVFEKALSREGIAYNSFASAREALDALSGGPPQVLISDIRMPGQSGIELLQQVRKHPRARDRDDAYRTSNPRCGIPGAPTISAKP